MFPPEIPAKTKTRIAIIVPNDNDIIKCLEIVNPATETEALSLAVNITVAIVKKRKKKVAMNSPMHP